MPTRTWRHTPQPGDDLRPLGGLAGHVLIHIAATNGSALWAGKNNEDGLQRIGRFQRTADGTYTQVSSTTLGWKDALPTFDISDDSHELVLQVCDFAGRHLVTATVFNDGLETHQELLAHMSAQQQPAPGQTLTKDQIRNLVADTTSRAGRTQPEEDDLAVA